MPNYDYKCEKCEEEFEISHGMTENKPDCPDCEANSLKKIITSVSFKVVGGTESAKDHSYTGRHRDLVKKRKGNKNYRDGHRDEVSKQEKIGLSDWKAELEMKRSQDMFEKMREEGMKMTAEEKEKLKEEYGIKKGKTNAGEIQF